MGDVPTLEHRGYQITYAENQDVWRCYAIDYEHVSLAKVKSKIDAVEREFRKLNRPAIYLNYDGVAKDCVIVSLDEDRDRCFITTDEPGTDRWGRLNGTLKREKVSLKQILADTPENRGLVEIVKEKRRAYDEAMTAHKAAQDAIPRLTREALLAMGVKKESETEET